MELLVCVQTLPTTVLVLQQLCGTDIYKLCWQRSLFIHWVTSQCLNLPWFLAANAYPDHPYNGRPVGIDAQAIVIRHWPLKQTDTAIWEAQKTGNGKAKLLNGCALLGVPFRLGPQTAPIDKNFRVSIDGLTQECHV